MTQHGTALHRLVWLFVPLWLLVACSQDRAEREKPRPRTADLTLFLREDFRVAEGVHCQVAEAEPVLTEPADGTRAEDLLVAKLSLSCRDRTERALPAREALPEAALVQVRDARGRLHAPSQRTRVSEHEPEALVFELADATGVLMSPRRFDAATGEPLGAWAHEVGALRLTLHDRVIDVHLRERPLDAAFDRFLKELVRSLAHERSAASSSPLGRMQALYRAVGERFHPRVLALSALEEQDGVLRVRLALEDSPLRDAPNPVASFELVAARTGQGELALEALVDVDSTTRAIDCADRLHALYQRIERAFRQAGGPAHSSCNALGVLLPGSCQDSDRELLADTLAARERCVALPALGPGRDAKLPDDFQLTLRRGRKSAGLDRDPRYVLTLFAAGQVVFHGRHWVRSSGRSDGRTTQRVLSALHARFVELAWFERRGGGWAPEGCSPEEDLGNVLTLHAGGRERMIVDRDGCRGPFTKAELEGLMTAIEGAAGLSAWTTPQPAYVDTGIEVWTIADD